MASLDTKSPWKLQTGKLVVDHGKRVSFEFSLSRNEASAVSEPVFFLVTKQDEDEYFPLRSGEFVLAPTRKQNEAAFWKYVTARDTPDRERTSATGMLIRILEGNSVQGTLQIGAFGGDDYCTTPDGTVPCGTGGFFRFNMQRQACPSDF